MDSKICNRCSEEKSLLEFAKRGSGRQTYCKACNREYQRKHYASNRDVYRERYYPRKNERHAEIRQRIADIKSSAPCTDCGQSYPFYVMHFDHLGDKEFHLSEAAGRSWKRIEAEMAKCDIVCANCHAERTHQRMLVK